MIPINYKSLSTPKLKRILKRLDGIKLKPVGSMSTMFALEVISSKMALSDEIDSRKSN